MYFISQQYSILIDKGPSIDFLKERVFYRICPKYCRSVQQLSTLDLTSSMLKIVNYINDHLTQDLSLKRLAERFDIHPVHLARKFKKELGLTFIDYLNKQKVAYAKYLFYLDQYNLNEVAYLAGFNSHSYFTKVFKKVCGLTPTQFVNKNCRIDK